MSALTISPAAVDDLPEVLAILNYEIEYQTSNFSYDPVTLPELTNQVENQTAKGLPFLVAKRDGAVLGYGTYGPFRAREGYKRTIEHSVYVSQTAHGQGIGKAIFQALRDKAVAQSYVSMIAVIGDENEGSIAFHKKMGFGIVGRIPRVAEKFDRELNITIMQLFL